MRSSNATAPRRKYMLNNCFLSLGQFEIFNSFFIARAGQKYSFRLKDHFDFVVEKQVLAIGTGTETTFQLNKIYSDNVSPHTRKITKPKPQTLSIWNNTEHIVEHSINYNSGVVILNAPLEIDHQIIASFEFDVPVRFVNDSFEYSFNIDGTISLDKIEMIEVIE